MQERVEEDGMRYTGRRRVSNVQPFYSIMLCAIILLLSIPVMPIETVSAYSEHDQIDISGNEDFTEENGVVDGSGTPDDPYLIMGWEITVLTGPAIRIVDTSASFALKDLCLIADSGHAARINNASSFSVEGCLVQGTVEISSCDDFSFVESTFQDGFLWLWSCNDFRFESNAITGSESSSGVSVTYSQDFVISGNDAPNSNLRISDCVNGKVTDNSLGRRGIDFSGGWDSIYSSMDISGNTIDGEPIVFVQGQDHASVRNLVVGQLIVANCNVVEIDNVELCSRAGIVVEYSQRVTIANCSNEDTIRGIMTSSCMNVTIARCSLQDCLVGVYAEVVRNATIENNLIDGCNESIYVRSYLEIPVIRRNMVSNTIDAIHFGSGGALIHSNCFIDIVNPGLALDPQISYDDICWNADYPLGGNYWSNNTGIDEFGGPAQDQEGADGFGDTPYSNGMAIDYYPLVEPLDIEFGRADDSTSNGNYLMWFAVLVAVIVASIGAGLILRRKR